MLCVQMTITLSIKQIVLVLLGCHHCKKTTTAMRMLSLGTPAKEQEEYCRMAPSTAREYMLHWCKGVRRCFEHEYLSQPIHNDPNDREPR
jgi:hypothetical protein